MARGRQSAFALAAPSRVIAHQRFKSAWVQFQPPIPTTTQLPLPNLAEVVHVRARVPLCHVADLIQIILRQRVRLVFGEEVDDNLAPGVFVRQWNVQPSHQPSPRSLVQFLQQGQGEGKSEVCM